MSYTTISNAARAAAYSDFAVAPSVYSEVAVAAPPVYAEAPSEDLAAELAMMKVMMEQMRQDKQRLETEANRKMEQAEMIAALRMEQKEARELAEIHKRLHETNMRSWAQIDDRSKALLSSLAQREIIIFYYYKQNLTYIITNKNIYRVWGFGYPIPKLGLIYTFDTTLTKKQILFLEKGLIDPDNPSYECRGALLKRAANYHYSSPQSGDTSAPKKVESIIRLIPGSYKNGDWKQLDGFFGMYFNETTMEFSEMPPPSL